MRLAPLLVAFACAAPVAPAQPTPPLALGPLHVELVYSAEASQFHAVDQLSAWYPHAHAAFGALAPNPTAGEQAALAEQRAIRSELPWGRGLEAAYYLGRQDAVTPAIREREQSVLAALASRTEALVATTQPHVLHFAGRLAETVARAAPTLDAAGRLFGTAARTLPVVLVARPGGGVGGGGANGGVLVVEVTRDERSLTPVVHEAVHVMLEPRRAELRAEATRCGTDPTTFEEVIVHAISPGIIHDGEGDALAAAAAAPFYAHAIALRPAMRRALAGGSFAALLHDTCELFARPK